MEEAARQNMRTGNEGAERNINEGKRSKSYRHAIHQDTMFVSLMRLPFPPQKYALGICTLCTNPASASIPYSSGVRRPVFTHPVLHYDQNACKTPM